ncbi:conserved hypothetical protein [Abyssogena phaseoliformis symbiont OG214]|uniref:hypothetical protein n=1 Tax=Abyssogena phaseoliformis symbiont TaxID=596095 RepID=UPI001915E674|nr:hypothetical protein [Abyssogena phaseoliformis symbiont]MBW5289546.1 hypothetical protein [Candidatus Ruthia sp. Apha_13_S6]BBB22417.1 conserved hypothetical protein [Abyssogena phaseoliformis symbiont OG214]
MKKQLLIAAVAATMSVAATADISITGDAYISFATQKAGANYSINTNKNTQRVRLKLVGSTGDTKVVAVIRNDSTTRVDNDGDRASGNGSLHTDSLYITTKAGPVSIKVGDYWDTIGLGARSKGAGKKNALSVSTKVGGWTLGMFTSNASAADGSDSTNVSASGKIGPVSVGLVHNPNSFTDLTAKATFGGISVAVERWDDKRTDIIDSDTTLIHVGGKSGNFKWDIAQIKNDVAAALGARNNASTGKLAPLGSMLIGTAARGGTATAAADVSNFTRILGIAVSTKLAGNTVKVIYTKNTMGADDKVTGAELIVSRPLSGATLTANVAKLSGVEDSTLPYGNVTNMGIRLDVKF